MKGHFCGADPDDDVTAGVSVWAWRLQIYHRNSALQTGSVEFDRYVLNRL